MIPAPLFPTLIVMPWPTNLYFLYSIKYAMQGMLQRSGCLLALCDSVVGNDNLATPLWFCFFKVVVAESFLFSSRRGVRAIVLSFKTRGLEFEILQPSLVLVRRGMSNLKYYIALAKSLVRKRVSSCGRHTLMQQV